MVKLIQQFRNKGTIIVGAGGAGDIISAYISCEILKDIFDLKKCLPLAVLWERWIIDPFPGPVPKDSIRNAKFSKCVWVTPETYVKRPDYSFKPQASIIAEVLGKEVPAVTLEKGSYGVMECLQELSLEGYGETIALDVGGDILAEGHEKQLLSPLTDSLILASLPERNSVVAVLAPGADGELPVEYVLKRIEKIASLGGYLGALGIWRDHLSIYEKILDKSKTESGIIPYRAVKGDMHDYIRSNGRVIDINPTSPIIYFLKTSSVLEVNTLAKKLRNLKSLKRAQQIAHTLRIPTELDLEVIASKKYGVGPNSSPSWREVMEYVNAIFRK